VWSASRSKFLRSTLGIFLLTTTEELVQTCCGPHYLLLFISKGTFLCIDDCRPVSPEKRPYTHLMFRTSHGWCLSAATCYQLRRPSRLVMAVSLGGGYHTRPSQRDQHCAGNVGKVFVGQQLHKLWSRKLPNNPRSFYRFSPHQHRYSRDRPRPFVCSESLTFRYSVPPHYKQRSLNKFMLTSLTEYL